MCRFKLRLHMLEPDCLRSKSTGPGESLGLGLIIRDSRTKDPACSLCTMVRVGASVITASLTHVLVALQFPTFYLYGF
jgi:hypothetical protein